ncbi:hypothetical protein GGI43DRAFT_133452 [Trichoderma evansii]
MLCVIVQLRPAGCPNYLFLLVVFGLRRILLVSARRRHTPMLQYAKILRRMSCHATIAATAKKQGGKKVNNTHAIFSLGFVIFVLVNLPGCVDWDAMG